MTLYLVLLLYIPMILLSICPEKDERILKWVFLCILLFFIFFHIDVGPDHQVYRWAYYTNPLSISFEPFFSLLLASAKMSGLDYIEFLIVLRLISFVLFAYACFKLDKTKFIFFMGLYIPISFITFELNLLRQSLSLHFGLVAVCLYLKNKEKSSYVFMILAVMSHLSAIVMFLIYLNKLKANVLVLLGMVGGVIMIFSLPAIISKVNDYQVLGELNIRFGVTTLQLVVLIILPFIFFKTQGSLLQNLFYVSLCCISFIPILIRLYPIALLILLPSIIVAKGNKKVTTLFLFVCISFFMTIGKTYLLLQDDQHAIQEGIYQHGYTQ